MAQTRENRCRTNMLYNAKRRANTCGYSFDLTLADVVWGEECPCCGVEYSFIQSFYTRRPSIDKLIPERGYVRDNVVFICTRCNQRKSDMTPKEMYTIADFFWEKIKEAIGARTGSDDREEVCGDR